jgi:hypothetical protein
MNKVLKGILAMVVFYIFNIFIMQIIGQYIFVGDPVTISYHLFTYTGLMTLCAVIVICTYVIIGKLNEIMNLYNKEEKDHIRKIDE